MRSRVMFLTLGAVCLMVLPARAQQGNEAEHLQQQIDQMQEKLKALRSPEKPKPRVTQLNPTRPPVEVKKEPELVVRIYDLSDLFAVAPPYPAMLGSDLPGMQRPMFPANESGITGGAMGGMGGGMMSIPSAAPHSASVPRWVLPQQTVGGTVPQARTSIEDLTDAITKTIAPAEWDSVGGPASIGQMGTSLLILATPTMHEQIDALLDSFRTRWGTLRTVFLQADWLWLTPAQLGTLLSTSSAKSGEPAGFGVIDEAAWQKLVEALAKDTDRKRGGYHAAITAYNGQTVHVMSGGQSLIIVGLQGKPAVGPGSPTAPAAAGQPVTAPCPSASFYQPDVTTLQDGAALQVTPIVSVSGKFVALDVHSRVVRLSPKPPAIPGDAVSGKPDLAIDRPQWAIQHLESTLRVPADRRMLVGGMTFEGQPQSEDPNLYLFVKLGVQELRDDVVQRGTIPGAAPSPPAKPAKPKK